MDENTGKGPFDGLNFDEILDETEATFRKGVESLGEWSNQARDVLQKPGTVMTAIALAGFVTGLYLRTKSPRLSRARIPIGADPLLLFAAGAAAGLIFGPQILEGDSERLRSVPPRH